MARPIEYWFLEDVKNQIYACVLLHNMMVTVRMERGETEDASLYSLTHNKEKLVEAAERLDSYVKRSLRRADADDHEHAAAHSQLQTQRWKELYDEAGHIKLQCAVMDQVAINAVNRREAKQRRRRRSL